MKLPASLEGIPARIKKAHIGTRAARTTGALWLPSLAAASHGLRLENQFILGGSVGRKKVYTFNRGKANNSILK